MKTDFKETPRQFTIKGVTISDHGKIRLEADDMVSFVTPSGKECDFAAKSWGFYLGPSVNGRLKHEGFKTCLAFNPEGRLYIHAVEQDKMEEFEEYMQWQNGRIICWLDDWMDPAY